MGCGRRRTSAPRIPARSWRTSRWAMRRWRRRRWRRRGAPSRRGGRCPPRRAARFSARRRNCSISGRKRVGRDLTREEGKTLAEGIGETRRAVPDPALLRGPDARTGRRDLSRATRRHLPLRPPRAGRRRRGDHAVELPHRHPGLEDRPGAGVRQHGRLEARRDRAADRRSLLAGARRCRAAAGRAQSRPRQGLGGRRRC